MADNRKSNLPPLHVKVKPVAAKRTAKAIIAAPKKSGPLRRFAPVLRGKQVQADAC